jgi:hypothetical protein
MQNNLLLKIALFNLSLMPLYLIFIIQYIDISVISDFAEYEEVLVFAKELIMTNNKILFFILLLVVGYVGLLVFEKNNNYNREDPKKFEMVESKDFDHLTFLSTYILPLITFNLNATHSFVVLVFLMFMIGTIYIKSNLYYLNPTLLLFGYKIYKAKESQNNVILISKSTLLVNCVKSRYIDSGNNIYFLKDKYECR